MSGGDITGIVIGTLVLVGGLCFAIVWIIRRKRQRQILETRKKNVFPFITQDPVPTGTHVDNKLPSGEY